jgi:hypothetical protein
MTNVERYNQGGPTAPAPAFTTQATAVEQSRAIAEVAAAVQVAQQCPRDMRRAWAEMEEACRRYDLADRAFYQVVNRGRGPSVHLARELARIWGNLDYGVHELSRDDLRGMSEIRAYAWDQQTNVRSSRTFQVPHLRMVKDKATGTQERKPLVDLQDVYLNNQNIGARAVCSTVSPRWLRSSGRSASRRRGSRPALAALVASGRRSTSPTCRWSSALSPGRRPLPTPSSRRSG